MKLLLLLASIAASLEAQVDLNTLFTRASVAGDLKTAETLLSSGLNPDSRDRFGRTLLINAAALGDPGAARLLLSYHADPNAKREPDGGESTPLQCAARTGNLEVAQLLINAGADVNAKGKSGRTPLTFAVLSGYLDMTRLLIEKGADVNTQDAEGVSPLDYAAWQGSLDMVAMLHAHGALLNKPATQTGATPINEAAYRGNTAAVQYLVQFHPNLDIPDKKGYGPLENAIRMGKEDSALLLLQAQPQLSENALRMAVKKDESRLIQELLRRKDGSLAMLQSGVTPLGLAASEGSVNVARLLLESGVEVDAMSKDGATPLEEASIRGITPIVLLLLDHGAKVNHVNNDSGATSLYAAAAFGRDEVVKLLLERGADPTLCGKTAKSALQAAVDNGFSGVAALIRQRTSREGCH